MVLDTQNGEQTKGPVPPWPISGHHFLIFLPEENEAPHRPLHLLCKLSVFSKFSSKVTINFINRNSKNVIFKVFCNEHVLFLGGEKAP